MVFAFDFNRTIGVFDALVKIAINDVVTIRNQKILGICVIVLKFPEIICGSANVGVCLFG